MPPKVVGRKSTHGVYRGPSMKNMPTMNPVGKKLHIHAPSSPLVVMHPKPTPKSNPIPVTPAATSPETPAPS